jgi:hypothetical protein
LVSALVYRGTTPAVDLVQAELSKMAPVEAQAGNYAERHAELLDTVRKGGESRGIRVCVQGVGVLEGRGVEGRGIGNSIADVWLARRAGGAPGRSATGVPPRV